MTYGYKSQQRSGGQPPGRTTSLTAATLVEIARTLVHEFARHGVRKLVVLNGHFRELPVPLRGWTCPARP
ncbi:creatininase family protein [Arthrobacter sp.]|uniref:creatininase family protein n=1 Tax=Arthrobacter sp. TaxID=1667 RepID=UPI003A94FEB5